MENRLSVMKGIASDVNNFNVSAVPFFIHFYHSRRLYFSDGLRWKRKKKVFFVPLLNIWVNKMYIKEKSQSTPRGLKVFLFKVIKAQLSYFLYNHKGVMLILCIVDFLLTKLKIYLNFFISFFEELFFYKCRG